MTGNSWTFIAYLDGDNDLGDDILSDMAEMVEGTRSAEIDILIQLDLPDGVPAKRYKIHNGTQTELENLGEVDMTDPQTLTDFLVWAKAEMNSSDHTILLLSDHGNGWDQLIGPSPVAKLSNRSMFVDWDDGSRRVIMHNHRVRTAIEAAEMEFDILALDASIMGTIEALYEFSDIAPIIISSQEVGYKDGWDYEYILKNLSKNTAMTDEAFSTLVVESYERHFEQVAYPADADLATDQSFNIAAHRSSGLKQIVAQTNTLAETLMADLNDTALSNEMITTLGDARKNAQKIDLWIQPYIYVDLKDFVTKLEMSSDIPTLIDETTIASYNGKDRPNASGLSVVFFQFPDSHGLTYDKNYKNWDETTEMGNKGKFINEFQWDEMLKTYYGLAFPELEL